MFSLFLESRREKAKELVKLLAKDYKFVSILGKHVKDEVYIVDKKSANIQPGSTSECGFVLKLSNGKAFFEYSLNDLNLDLNELKEKIENELDFNDLNNEMINVDIIKEEELKKSFVRESDYDKFSDKDILDSLINIKDLTLSKSKNLLNVRVILMKRDISSLYISTKRELDQNWTWSNGMIISIYNENDKTVMARVGDNYNNIGDVLKSLPNKIDELISKSHYLSLAKPIVPGVYDVITHPSISGLIAHEAFGHGVEMDQFVKDRALAKEYVGKYVASPLVNMVDGASACLSQASYFFDDNGTLAGNTRIIKDGILVSGICDQTSGAELNFTPTGNGRRETFKRKAYTRMTNTFFLGGDSDVNDMIKSIKHGYMLFETNNGMEDPKNWAIQCVCEYGIEIVDGKLTDNYVSPVVMSGYVPDLLKSISMVSKDVVVTGSGSCGKGYKEWVRVSDGGPYLKAKVKLA